MNRKILIAVLLVGAVMTGSVAASGMLADTTDSYAISGSEDSMVVTAASSEVGANALMITKGGYIDQRGAATLKEVASPGHNVTIVGTGDRNPAYTYLANVEEDDGASTYTVRSRTGVNPSQASAELVQHHWNSASGVVLTSTNITSSARAVVSEYAQANGMPVIYVNSVEQFDNRKTVLTELGVSSVHYVGVGSDVVNAAEEEYGSGNVSAISTSNARERVNNMTSGANGTVVVTDAKMVPQAAAGVPNADVYWAQNESSVEGMTFSGNVWALTNNEYVAGAVNGTHVSYTTTSDALARLTLQRNDVQKPVVVPVNTQAERNGNTIRVRVDIRNIGFQEGSNVTVTLAKQNATFDTVTGPSHTVENGTVTWTFDSISEGDSQTLTFEMSGGDVGSGDSITVQPSVQSYNGPGGASFSGFSLFGDITDKYDEVKTTLSAGVSQVLDALPFDPVAAGIIGTIAGLAGAVIILIRRYDQ